VLAAQDWKRGSRGLSSKAHTLADMRSRVSRFAESGISSESHKAREAGKRLLDLSVVVLSYDDVRRQTARGVKLVDIRTPREFVYLHLVGAIPLAAPRFGYAILSAHRLSPEDRVIIVAQSPVQGHVAAQEIDAQGVDVVGVFAALPRTWEAKGLTVQKGELVFPDRFLAYLRDHPTVDLVDVREPVEQERFPFPHVTRSMPFSTWPDGVEHLDPTRPIIFLAGKDDRAILAARDVMILGFAQVGYLVGGYEGFHHPRLYDPREAARTTAHHGVFI
jgi:rhodanese-related sulfurtransferase